MEFYHLAPDVIFSGDSPEEALELGNFGVTVGRGMCEYLSVERARDPERRSPGGALFSSLGRQLRFIVTLVSTGC